MNFGRIDSRGNNAAKRTYAALCAQRGQWLDAWSLAMSIETTCIGTIISEVRMQLEARRPVTEVIEHKQTRDPETGKCRQWYRVRWAEVKPVVEARRPKAIEGVVRAGTQGALFEEDWGTACLKGS